jgi:hypothetical protein
MNKFILGAALLALGACNGETATVTDTGTETGDTDTGETGTTVTYDTVGYISMIATFGWDATNSQFVDYSLTSQGQAATQSPAIVIRLSDGANPPAPLCDIYIQQAGPINNTATLPGDVTTPIGLILDTATATVVDGGTVGLTACDNLDPDIWGADVAAAVAAGGLDFGFVVTDAMYSSHGLWSTLSGGLTSFSTAWEPYIVSGSSYMEGSGVQMGSTGGGATEIGFGRSYAFSTGFDVGDLGTATYVPKADALTTSGAFNMQTLSLPFTSANKADLLGQ